MNARVTILTLAMLVGVASGPSSLESAANSQPPLQWADLAYIGIGCCLGLPFVLGFQALIGNMRALRIGWNFFAIGAVFFLGTGISALITALLRSVISPSSFLFLALGVGATAGVAASQLLFRNRLTNAA